MNIKKAVRTVQVEFPFLLEWKFQAIRKMRAGLKRPFERDFAAIPLLSPPRDALFLDVGANRGQSTDAILMMHPGAQIELFEPNELLFGRLQGQFRNVPNLTMHNFGLGDQQMEAELHVPFYKKWMFDGLASFDEHKARNWLDGRVYFFKQSHVRVEKSMCRVQRLDDFGLSPFFVKIDVQGFELNVLKGARQTLAEHHPVLLIEKPDTEIIEFLAELGYEQNAFADGRFHAGQRGRPNTFFLTPDAAARIRQEAR